jgi:hypothetical protein
MMATTGLPRRSRALTTRREAARQSTMWLPPLLFLRDSPGGPVDRAETAGTVKMGAMAAQTACLTLCARGVSRGRLYS